MRGRKNVRMSIGITVKSHVKKHQVFLLHSVSSIKFIFKISNVQHNFPFLFVMEMRFFDHIVVHPLLYLLRSLHC